MRDASILPMRQDSASACSTKPWASSTPWPSPLRSRRTLRSHGPASGDRAPLGRRPGSAPAPRQGRRRPLVPRPRHQRTRRAGRRSAPGRECRRAAAASRNHRRERATVSTRGPVAGLRRGAGTAGGSARHRARRDPPPHDGRLGSQGAGGLQRRRHPAGRAAERRVHDRTLVEVRKRGWAQSAAEREPGVASVSAPVRDGRGAVVAAVSVSGPIDRMGRRPGARWAADLLAAAEALTRRL